MRVGVLLGGDHVVRAAHSLAADPIAEEVVVVGPAKSRSFRVVDDPTGCDVLVGSGPGAPGRARSFGIPLIWDGGKHKRGVAVWGASLAGLATAMASRERKVDLVAVAHPDEPAGRGRSIRFARPVGATQTDVRRLGDRQIHVGRSYNEFGACLVATKRRNVTIVDRAAFLSGIALAAGAASFGGGQAAVWDDGLRYLETAVGMGLVMAEG